MEVLSVFMAAEEFLRENITEVKDIEALADYVAVQIRQANELREASREAVGTYYSC